MDGYTVHESEALNQFNETRHRSVRKECPEGAQHIRMQEKSIREKSGEENDYRGSHCAEQTNYSGNGYEVKLSDKYLRLTAVNVELLKRRRYDKHASCC